MRQIVKIATGIAAAVALSLGGTLVVIPTPAQAGVPCDKGGYCPTLKNASFSVYSIVAYDGIGAGGQPIGNSIILRPGQSSSGKMKDPDIFCTGNGFARNTNSGYYYGKGCFKIADLFNDTVSNLKN